MTTAHPRFYMLWTEIKGNNTKELQKLKKLRNRWNYKMWNSFVVDDEVSTPNPYCKDIICTAYTVCKAKTQKLKSVAVWVKAYSPMCLSDLLYRQFVHKREKVALYAQNRYKLSLCIKAKTETWGMVHCTASLLQIQIQQALFHRNHLCSSADNEPPVTSDLK